MLAEDLLKREASRKGPLRERKSKSAVLVSYQGEQWTVIELAERLGLSQNTLRARIKSGLPEEEWGKEIRKHGARGVANPKR